MLDEFVALLKVRAYFHDLLDIVVCGKTPLESGPTKAERREGIE